MTRMISITALVVAGSCLTGVAHAQASRDVQAAVRQFRALGWAAENGITLPDSGLVLAPIDGVSAVTGMKAVQARLIQDGTPTPGVEAELIDEHGLDAVFSWLPIGFVDDGEFGHLNADQLLAGMRASTERDNAARRAGGVGEIVVKGWVQKPVVDAGTYTLSWIAQADQGGKPLFNASALLFGRKGVERVQMVSYKDAENAREALARVLEAAHFPAGATYADHVAADLTTTSGAAELGLPGVGSAGGSSSGALALLATPGGRLSEALPRIIGLSLFLLVVFGLLIRRGLRGRKNH